jgi:RNA polymerase sigma factor (sigma-70 family)
VIQDACMEDRHADPLEQLFRFEGPRLWRALVGFTGDPETASDALAEAFAQLLARGEGVRSPDRWVWRAAFRIAAGDLAPRSKTPPAPSERVDDPMESVRDIVIALRMLSPKQRAAIVLHDYAGYATRDVGSILGMSPATARVHLSQARRRLRALLEDYRWQT